MEQALRNLLLKMCRYAYENFMDNMSREDFQEIRAIEVELLKDKNNEK